jgi:hypothetical protein
MILKDLVLKDTFFYFNGDHLDDDLMQKYPNKVMEAIDDLKEECIFSMIDLHHHLANSSF